MCLVSYGHRTALIERLVGVMALIMPDTESDKLGQSRGHLCLCWNVGAPAKRDQGRHKSPGGPTGETVVV